MTEETLGTVVYAVAHIVVSAMLVIGFVMGFLMSNKINGDADERTARLFNMICEAE